jgi:hypothetical protein
MFRCVNCNISCKTARGLHRHSSMCVLSAPSASSSSAPSVSSSSSSSADAKETPAYRGPQCFHPMEIYQECMANSPEERDYNDDNVEDEETVIPDMSWQYMRLEAETSTESNDFPLGHPDYECYNKPMTTYKTLQEKLFTNTCGVGALNSNNIDEFRIHANVPDADPLLRLRLSEFGSQANLSRDNGNELLRLIKLFNPRETVPVCWETLLRKAKIETNIYSYCSTEVPWPPSWNMDSWNSGRAPDKVVIRVRDPVEMLAYQCIDPILQFQWRNDIKYEYTEERIEGTQTRTYGDLMSSPWGKENQEHIRQKHTDPTGILMPVILYSDGIVVDKNSNQKLNSALGTCGNYSHELMKQNRAKFCLGNIPVIFGVSGQCVIDHIISQGYSKTAAEKKYRMFHLHIERAFWREIVACIKHVNTRGAYMYILGKGLCTVYTNMTPPLGDEPDLKRKCGVYEGAATCACIRCEYPLRSRIPYDPEIHPKRNAADIIQCCAQAEHLMQKLERNNGYRLSSEEKKTVDALHSKSIHPMKNAFHDPNLLGINNSIYDVTADPYHVFLAGIFKNGTTQIASVIDCISKDPAFKSSKSIVDAKLVLFPSMPHMPHLGWTTFQKGLTELATKKSKSAKGKGSSSAGGYRSSCFSAALMQLYFTVSVIT